MSEADGKVFIQTLLLKPDQWKEKLQVLLQSTEIPQDIRNQRWPVGTQHPGAAKELKCTKTGLQMEARIRDIASKWPLRDRTPEISTAPHCWRQLIDQLEKAQLAPEKLGTHTQV